MLHFISSEKKLSLFEVQCTTIPKMCLCLTKASTVNSLFAYFWPIFSPKISWAFEGIPTPEYVAGPLNLFPSVIVPTMWNEHAPAQWCQCSGWTSWACQMAVKYFFHLPFSIRHKNPFTQRNRDFSNTLYLLESPQWTHFIFHKKEMLRKGVEMSLYRLTKDCKP